MRTTAFLTRREALATLGAGVLATRTALSADALFRFGALDHLALAVDDTEKSVRFYTRVFGNTVLKEKTNPRHYVKLGPNYVAMAPAGQGQASQVINHFCPGVTNFDLAATKHALDQMGIQYREATASASSFPTPTARWFSSGPKTPGAIWAKPLLLRRSPPKANRCSGPLASTTSSSTSRTSKNPPRFTRRFSVPSLILLADRDAHGLAAVAATASAWRWPAPARSPGSTTIASPRRSTAPRWRKPSKPPAQRSFRETSPRASISSTSTASTCRLFRPHAPDRRCPKHHS
jgi:glyoxalase/bleomycin resistance protein/dioxygenase superfamily protein